MAFCKHNGGGPETCPACKREGSKSALIDLLPAERLKKAVSEVLSNALGGRHPSLRTDDGFIRWGLIEKSIHQEIDAELGKGR